MNKKEMKAWVKDAISKGYDRDDISDLLEGQVEAGKMTMMTSVEMMEIYDNETAEVEKIKIGFLARRRLRKHLRKLKDVIEEGSIEAQELNKNLKALNKKEKAKLEKLRENMIIAIVGDVEKKKEGLSSVFEIADEDGQEVKREDLEKMPLEDIEVLLADLIDALEREI